MGLDQNSDDADQYTAYVKNGGNDQMAGKTYPDADVTGRKVDSGLESLVFVVLAV